VVRALGSADIIGDPSVREAVAEGPHIARREGDTLVIEGDDEFDMRSGFMFGWDQNRDTTACAAATTTASCACV